MKGSPNSHRFMVVVAALCLVASSIAAVGVVWWRVRASSVPTETFQRAPWWEGHRVDFPRHKPHPNASDDFNAFGDLVWNQIAQRDRWTVADVEMLQTLILRDFVHAKDQRGASMRDIEPFLMASESLALMGEWLGTGAPIDLDARALAEHILLELLDHPNWVLRQLAIVAIVNSGMIADDFARNAVLSKASDPDPDVARTVGEQMAKYEHLLQRAEQARQRRERSDG
jgi:hypothetical protein